MTDPDASGDEVEETPRVYVVRAQGIAINKDYQKELSMAVEVSEFYNGLPGNST